MKTGLGGARSALALSAGILGLAACEPASQITDPSPAQLSTPPIESPDFAFQASDLAPDPAVLYGTLPNGMRYALRANATPSDTASLLLRFDAGSLDETDSTRGLAHFLEHMAFNGSEAYAEGELVPALERLGLAFGADTNAYTSFQETVYRLELPNLSDGVVETALGAMRETASRLTLDPQAIARERGVIQSERLARKSPAASAAEESLAFLLAGTPYPDRLPIGTEATIDSVQAEDFRRFYNGFYRPDNAVLVMVGDFDPAAMEARIRESFSDWTPAGESLAKRRPDSLPERAPRESRFIDPEVSTRLSAVAYRSPDTRADTSETRRERLLDGIGAQLLNRRFARISSQGDADFLGASVAAAPLFDMAQTVSLNLSAAPGAWRGALDDAVAELQRARLYCFTEAELDEWKLNTRRALERAVETSGTRRTPGLASELLGTIAAERVLTTPLSALERYATYADSIDLDDVCARFQTQLQAFESADLFLIDSVDVGDGELRAAFDAALAAEVESKAARELGDFAYSDWGEPGRVVARDRIEDIDVTTVEFENGVRLNIKVTPYQDDQVRARASIGGGLFNAPSWPEGFSQIAGAVLAEGGLEAHSRDDLRSLLAGRAAVAGVSVGTELVSIDGSAAISDMGLMFDLMTASVTALGYREEAVRNFRRDLAAFYDQIDSTPAGVARRDVPRLLRSGDPRFGLPDRDLLETLDADIVRDTLEPLLDSGLIEIGVVGDVDPDAVTAEVARTFGSLEARPTTLPGYAPSRSELAFPDPGSVTLTHAGDPDSALYQVFFPAFGGEDTLRARRAGLVRRIAQLKLTDVLREREGRSYSPSVTGYFPEGWDDYGFLGIGVTTRPDEIDEIARLVAEVADDMGAGRITVDEFDRARAPVLESVERSLEENGYWLGVVDRLRTYPDVLDDHRSRVATFQNMTLEDVRPIAESIFDKDRAFSVRILSATRP